MLSIETLRKAQSALAIWEGLLILQSARSRLMPGLHRAQREVDQALREALSATEATRPTESHSVEEKP